MKMKLAFILIACLICLFLISCNSSYFVRALVYNYPSIEDYKIFPKREIKNSDNADIFVKDTARFDLTSINQRFRKKYNLPSSPDFETFLIQSETTAFIILKNDTLIYEKYFNRYKRNSINTSFSTAKSVVSALVGIALDEGYIEDIHDPVSKYLPEIKEKATQDLTIKFLLSMTSGIAYDGESTLLGDDAKSYYSPDLRAYALNFSMQNKPGERFKYNNINPLLIGMIIERTTGVTVSRYLEKKIWQPLGMEFDASWSLDENGFEKMESGINARAIDFLKFGRLYLNNGVWKDRQIISKSYVQESTRIDSDNLLLKNIREEISYGYYWWIFNRYKGQDDFYAEGNLGQYIYISPHTKTVIVRHGKDYGYKQWAQFFYRLTNEISGLPLSDNPFEIAHTKAGLDAAIALADSLNQTPSAEKISEYYLNKTGYALLMKGQNEKAIAVFQLNVRCYPESYNVYDSIGEAYLVNKQTDLALKNYQKSLALNPNNKNAAEVVNSLR